MRYLLCCVLRAVLLLMRSRGIMLQLALAVWYHAPPCCAEGVLRCCGLLCVVLFVVVRYCVLLPVCSSTRCYCAVRGCRVELCCAPALSCTRCCVLQCCSVLFAGVFAVRFSAVLCIGAAVGQAVVCTDVRCARYAVLRGAMLCGAARCYVVRCYATMCS
jgi:hypothetical protein